MRILVTADNDDFTWRGGDGQADVLVSCGDVCGQLIVQAAEAYKCSRVFAVKGNHDSGGSFPAPIIDLHLRVEEYGAVRFGGLNGSWKYEPRGHSLYEQSEVRIFLEEFPYVDVFVSHNSPRSIHDTEDEVHTGFDALLEYIRRYRPRMLIHGHQHINSETIVEGTKVIAVYGHRMIEA